MLHPENKVKDDLTPAQIKRELKLVQGIGRHNTLLSGCVGPLLHFHVPFSCGQMSLGLTLDFGSCLSNVSVFFSIQIFWLALFWVPANS